jgi:ParB-like chromosome segregation protein Spo0J
MRSRPASNDLKEDRMNILSKQDGLPPPFDATKLRPHPIAAQYPAMDPHEFEALKASIKQHGILEPIAIYGEPLMILDGTHRHAAAMALGLPFTARNFTVFTGTYEDAEAFSNAKNGHRRHLTAKQKEERVKAYVAKHPNATLREVARICGVSHNTVAKYKAPPGEKDFKKFTSTWDELADEHRARFAKEYASELRALL